MATTVDTLLVRIEADLADVKRNLRQFDNRLDQTVGRTGRALNKIGGAFKLVMGAVIIQQVARAALEVVNFVSHVEEMQAKSGVVFGAFAGDVRQQLAAFGDEVGRSRFQLEEMAASVQDTFVPMGFARGEAAQLSVQLTKLATDVASFNNASDTETMAAFQSAIVGNHETVRRFGIVITEGTLQQELYRMGLNKTTQEATNAEKVQARLNLIMAGTTDAQGDAARTADSFANQSKRLGAELELFAVEVLQPLMGDLADFVGVMADAVKGTREFLKEIGIIPPDLSQLPVVLAEIAEAEEELARARAQAEKFTGGHTGRNARNRVADLEAEIAALQERATALRTAEAPPEEEGGTTEPDSAAQKAQEKAVETLTDLRNANELLRLEMGNLSETTIEFHRISQGLVGAEEDTLALILEQVTANANLQARLDARAEATKKLETANQRANETVESLAQEARILGIALGGATEAEIAQAEAAYEHRDASQAVVSVMQGQIATNHALRAALDEQREAEEALERVKENATAQIAELEQQQQLLLFAVRGATEAELAQAEASLILAGADQAQIDRVRELIAANADLQSQVDWMNKLQDDATKRAEAEASRQETITERIADMRFETEQLIEQIKGRTEAELKLAEVERELGGLSEAQRAEMEELIQAQADYQAQLDQINETKDKWKNAMEEIEKSIAEGITDALFEGQGGMDQFLNFAKNFVKELIAEFIRVYIIRSILNSILPGAGAAAGGGGTVDTAAGGGRVRIPTFANGGQTAGGGPMLVGERGPELFIPGSAGTIKNNHDTKNLLGGGRPVVVQQTLQIGTGVSDTVRAELLGLMPQIRQDTVSAVAEAKRRGGSFSAAFGG